MDADSRRRKSNPIRQARSAFRTRFEGRKVGPRSRGRAAGHCWRDSGLAWRVRVRGLPYCRDGPSVERVRSVAPFHDSPPYARARGVSMTGRKSMSSFAAGVCVHDIRQRSPRDRSTLLVVDAENQELARMTLGNRLETAGCPNSERQRPTEAAPPVPQTPHRPNVRCIARFPRRASRRRLDCGR
jgi:hypothetical protein